MCFITLSRFVMDIAVAENRVEPFEGTEEIVAVVSMDDPDETRSSVESGSVGGGLIEIPSSDPSPAADHHVVSSGIGGGTAPATLTPGGVPDSPGSRSNYGEFYWCVSTTYVAVNFLPLSGGRHVSNLSPMEVE